MAFPDSSSVLDKFWSARIGTPTKCPKNVRKNVRKNCLEGPKTQFSDIFWTIFAYLVDAFLW